MPRWRAATVRDFHRSRAAAAEAAILIVSPHSLLTHMVRLPPVLMSNMLGHGLPSHTAALCSETLCSSGNIALTEKPLPCLTALEQDQPVWDALPGLHTQSWEAHGLVQDGEEEDATAGAPGCHQMHRCRRQGALAEAEGMLPQFPAVSKPWLPLRSSCASLYEDVRHCSTKVS